MNSVHMRTFCQVKPKTCVKTNALCAMHYKCCNPSGCILYTWQVWLWNQHKFCSVGDISISVLVRTSMINCSISEIKTQAMKIAIIIVNLKVLSSKLMGRGIKGFYWEYFMLLICQTLPSWTWRQTDHRMLDMQTGSYSSQTFIFVHNVVYAPTTDRHPEMRTSVQTQI